MFRLSRPDISTRPGPFSAGQLPPGRRVYAIGDIHGRADLLGRLLADIRADAASRPTGVRPLLLTLGDYVDRGADSAGVIELLLHPPDGFDFVALAGNHEDMMLLALGGDAEYGQNWLINGGGMTLASYGLDPEEPTRLAVHMPVAHRDFFRDLVLCHREGGYFFAHAGIEPSRALDQQTRDDLLWVRRRFLESQADFGAVVVHGHSVRPEVEFRANRIGIDTGAYRNGHLTCLVLDGTERRVMGT